MTVQEDILKASIFVPFKKIIKDFLTIKIRSK